VALFWTGCVDIARTITVGSVVVERARTGGETMPRSLYQPQDFRSAPVAIPSVQMILGVRICDQD
jgi:hypothetical protein